MEQHAISLLREAEESWPWPETFRKQHSGELGGKYKAVTARLLSAVFQESCKLGGTLLEQFWVKLGEGHPRLKINIAALKANPQSVQDELTATTLFDGIQKDSVDFSPLMHMAGEIWTHLAVAFVNPGGRKSASGTPRSVDDLVRMETNALAAIAEDEPSEVRKQAALTQLSLRRDGESCPLTGTAFNTHDPGNGIKPYLAHVIPHSVHKKPDTLRLIGMFAGPQVAELAAQHLNKIGNAMNIESNAHSTFDDLMWGIEAQTAAPGTVSYIYRRIAPHDANTRGPGYIRFKDGDHIPFGVGPEGESLGLGPLPLLCNLHLAVARVMRMSGAVEVIMKLMDEADDSDFPHIYVASDAHCDILAAKLLLVS